MSYKKSSITLFAFLMVVYSYSLEGFENRLKKSPKWEMRPNMQHGNSGTKGTAKVHNKGENHDFGGTVRIDKRSIQPGAPNFPVPGQKNNGGWQVNPDIHRDGNGNTHTSVGVKHKGPNHNVDASWSKTVRGHKTKPTWHVRGTYRFRRSPDWVVNPNVEHQDGKTRGTVGIQNTGPNHEIDEKVGTNKSFQLGSTIRFKRTPEWEISQNVQRDGSGTKGAVEVHNKTQNRNFQGSWSTGNNWKLGEKF